MSINITNNSPSRDHSLPDDHATQKTDSRVETINHEYYTHIPCSTITVFMCNKINDGNEFYFTRTKVFAAQKRLATDTVCACVCCLFHSPFWSICGTVTIMCGRTVLPPKPQASLSRELSPATELLRKGTPPLDTHNLPCVSKRFGELVQFIS